MIQTKLESFGEQVLNVGSGFIISYSVWIFIVQPLLDKGVLQLDDAFYITAIFTITSVIRGYCWRRAFNYWSENKMGISHKV
jgi:hypothetical protein